MARQVKLPNGKIGAFPDDFSDQQIETVLQKQFPKEENKPINYKEFLKEGAGNFIKGGERIAKNLAIGGTKAGRGLANTPHNLANLVGAGEYIPKFGDVGMENPNFDEEAYGLEKPVNDYQHLSDKLIQGLGQYAPAMALPGLNIGKSGEAIGAIPKVGKFAQQAIEQAIPQSAYGATQNENPLIGAFEGGIGSLAGSAIGTAIKSGINALRPSKIFRGELSSQQLKNNLESTKGTETGLGRVIENPLLTRVQENVLPNILGSGAENTLQKNAKSIQEKGTELINKLRGDIEPHQFGIKLQDSLKTALNEARAGKNSNYNSLNELADKHHLKVGRQNFQDTAAKTISDIQESPELKHEFGTDLYKSLLRYASNKEGNSLKLTNIFRGKLGDKANELYQSGKMHEYGIVNDLKEALSKDIKHSFEESGNAELEQAYQKSQKEYKENYAPFEDKDIVKFTRQGGDPDLILSHFLKSGNNDRATLLAKLDRAYKLNNKSKEKTNNLLSSAYLSKAFNEEGEINPIKLRTLYNKLGHNQRKILFGEGKTHNEIKNYVDLVGKNTEAFNLMHNPKTGHRLATLAQMVTAPAHIGSALLAALGGRTVNKILTSPGYREKLINAMIKNKQFELPKIKNALQKGGAIAAQQKGENYGNKPMELELNTYNKTK